MTTETPDPLAPIKAVLDSWEMGFSAYPTLRTIDHELRTAITEARALLGEVSVREEWVAAYGEDALGTGDGVLTDTEKSVREFASKRGGSWGVYRRTTTTHTTEWLPVWTHDRTRHARRRK